MDGFEEHEYFSEEFKSYWYKPRNINTITQIQSEYNNLLHERVKENLDKLEECIQKNTTNLITDKPYDIEFKCFNIHTLPPYKKIDQGFGDISKPYVPDEFLNLKYLEKPLIQIGITPKQQSGSKLAKNTFEINHNGSDFIHLNCAAGYINIRISNT